jgi:hypothetical protein
MFIHVYGVCGTVAPSGCYLATHTDLDRIGPWRNEWEETKPKVVIENQSQLQTDGCWGGRGVPPPPFYESLQT